MSNELLSVVALALACGGWVLLQRWLARLDPEGRGVEGGCGGCGACDHPSPGPGPGAGTPGYAMPPLRGFPRPPVGGGGS